MAEPARAHRKHRGELNPRAAEGRYRACQLAPSEDLADCVQYYWLVRWDLTGKPPYDQEVLPKPCLHIVFEAGAPGAPTTSRVVGLVTRKFTRRLEGEGQVLGVAFHPGAFYPWLGVPVSRLTDRMVPLDGALSLDGRALERSILGPDDDGERVRRVERFLRERMPAPDATVAVVKRTVERISSDPGITRVEDLVPASGLGKRTLQRLFHRYVGAGPKWVIRRFRLIEAARRLESGDAPNLAALAQSLGYFDQAHFIKDFKGIVGRTPAEYARDAGAPPGPAARDRARTASAPREGATRTAG